MTARGIILLTGGTGYVGGRLIKPLEETGRPLRVMVRDPQRLRPNQPPTSFEPRVADGTEVVKGDVLDVDSLRAAMAGVDTAYYLVHSLGAVQDDLYEREIAAARNFAGAAREAGVRRIIYLGALGSADETLSAHLASRQDAGRELCESGAEVVEFRASVILGSGSISFEMVRGLVDRLPVMTTPRWVETLTQPIAIEDVVAYLLAALDKNMTERCTIYEIGGADWMSYGEMMRAYAKSQRLRRYVIRVPLLTPRLSAAWLALVTPIYYRIGRHLLDGLRNQTVVTDFSARDDFPDIKPMGVEAAIARALANEDRAFAQTRWSDARSSTPELVAKQPKSAHKIGRRYIEQRILEVGCPPGQVFGAVLKIGGENGWYAWSWLWALRGAIDKLFGGVGIHRGRRDPSCAIPGDTIDCWRVEELEPDRKLLLTTEMRGPGRGWLQFDCIPLPDGGTRLIQTATWDPIGLGGHLYWWSLWPAHKVIFSSMIRAIAREGGCGLS